MKTPTLRRSRFLRKRTAAVAALLLILFLFRPGVYRLRNRIASSIGSALGRRVALDNVRLRLLPRPGFDLEGLVIYDDPQFSAEPMIRAQEVSAAIRLRSLLRGRLEIATLSASEPSINLVRNDGGLWNLASLIERNAQIPAAPTRKPASERRPAFPYLEATNARISFKFGQIKKSYALTNAEVALWQESDNSWGARMRAEPVRTDFNLTDTGLLQIEATWQRAFTLRSTPLQVSMRWRNCQLGQLTKLLSGNDHGWRGGVDVIANISGTPEALQIASTAAVDGFHRYDIVGTENVRLATNCSASYNAPTRRFSGVLCESPVNDGRLRLHGDFDLALAQPMYDLTLEAERVPLTAMVRLLRQTKQQVPADLTATGLLNAEFHGTHTHPTAHNKDLHGLTTTWTGTGAATNVRVLWTNGNERANLGTIPLAVIPANRLAPLQQKMSDPITTKTATRQQNNPHEPVETHLRIGPVSLAMNDSTPFGAGGWISKAGYRFFLQGDAELKDLFQLEKVLALSVVRPAAEGSARLDVSASGLWQNFAPAVTAGTAQLHNVHAEVRGMNTPIEIASATITIKPDEVLMDKIAATTGTTHWNGRVTALRHCVGADTAVATLSASAPACLFQFDLTADQLLAAELAAWFTRHPAERPWYRILDSTANSGGNQLSRSPLLALRAKGTLHVSRIGLKKLFATEVTTKLEVDRGTIKLTDLRAQLLQGTHRGDWMIDLSNPDSVNEPVRYRASGVMQDIAMSQLAALTNDAWITGTADGKFELEGSAVSVPELLTHSNGKLQFVIRNGSLPHIEIPGSPTPFPIHYFAGDLRLAKRSWELIGGSLESRDGIYQVKGTVSPLDGLSFLLTHGNQQSWMLTGTPDKPHIAPADKN